MSGSLTVTPSNITWFSDASPFTPNIFALTGGTGSFATENGQNGILNLSIATAPVGSVISPPLSFIHFNVAAGLPDLNLTYINPGNGGSAGCSNPVPAVNQTCTPTNPGGSPFTFTNDSASTSDAKFVFSGVTSDGLSSWTIIFTSQFTAPFQTVLAGFGQTNGSIHNSYSAAEVTVTAGVPEPGTLMLAGLAVIAAALALRKHHRV